MYRNRDRSCPLSLSRFLLTHPTTNNGNPQAIYIESWEQLKKHAEVHGKEERQRATDAWLASRTPQQQSDYRERTTQRLTGQQQQQR